MFYLANLRRDVLLEACYLGKSMKERVKRKLSEELEGKCLGKKGFIILILDVPDKNIEPGLIDNDTGGVYVTVHYDAVLMRPFKNEVLDAIVTSASDEKGFMCRVGPLEIFVSGHRMPEDMSFDFQLGDCWVSEDGAVEIKEGSIVRVRIIGVNDAGSDVLVAMGCIQDKCLGQLEI